MNKYIENLHEETRKYFEILSSEFPEWLLEYIDTPEMERLGNISLSCGMDYSGCFKIHHWYSNLDHSVGVALIIWHFTHDKKQTLAGLFHDISSPAFRHCIDFMNGDSETQESTEEGIIDFIRNSKKIMSLLERDGIKLEEVYDYKIYPIADNNTPRLSADRFEYTFSSGLTFFRVFDIGEIKEIYSNIVIVKNEDGKDELAFKDKEVCEHYIHILSKLWPEWVSDRDRTAMQFLADICKSMSIAGYLTIDDLYKLSESEIISKILNCGDAYLSESFKKFQTADTVYVSDAFVDGKYCVNTKTKTRYVCPLVLTEKGVFRINEVSEQANNEIYDYLTLSKGGYYTYFDFEFTPYETGKTLSKKDFNK